METSCVIYICNTISKGIGILVRARQIFYGETLATLYNALIKPHFTYCITVWGNTYKNNLNRLHIMHKKIVRILTSSEFHAHTEPLYNKLCMMNFYEMRAYFVGVFVYKSINNLQPAHLNNLFFHNQIARFSMNLKSKYCKRQSCRFSIKVVGPTIWNNFSSSIKMARSLYTFKRLLKCELLQ